MSPSLRTVSIGSATCDLFIRTSDETLCGDGESIRLALGSKIRLSEVIETCGGGAANTAVGLARLNCNAHFCGMVGSDEWGQRIVANLQREQVGTEAVTYIEGETSSFSIVMNVACGERVILYNTGIAQHLHDATFDRDMLATCDWVYLNHISDESCDILDDLTNILAANKKMGLTWNPGGRQLKRGVHDACNAGLLKNTQLLLINREEMTLMTKTEDIKIAFRLLHDAGVHTICMTDGKHGSIGSNGQDYVECGTLDTNVIDATGAGDSFGVGATWASLQDQDLSTVLKAGTLNAASVLQKTGAQPGLLTDTEMRHRLNSIPLVTTVRSF
jgi:sugar/nucleoside kinase (ribokinase family)